MKNNYFFILISLLLLVIISGCTSRIQYDEKPKPINVNISLLQDREVFESGPLFILDVRTEEEYNSGHLKNAVLIPLQDLNNKEKLKNIPREKNILVYSSDSRNSTIASEILIDNGFTQVFNVMDGIGAEIVPGYEMVK